MRSAGTIELPEEFSESKRAALLNLLGDDDPAVFQTVREKILSCGPPAAEWLRPHTLSGDPALRRRTRQIVRHFDRQAADNQFLGFCLKHGEDFSLELGLEPKELLGQLNAYMFGELHFAGNEKNYYDPENSYLNRVIDRRTGN